MIAVLGVAGFLVLSAATVLELVKMRSVAHTQGLIDRLDVNAVLTPTSSLANISFQPAVPSVETSHSEAGLELRANAPVGHYLLMAQVNAHKRVSMIVRYRVTLKRGAVGLGVLSGDATRWLSSFTLDETPARTVEGIFTSSVEVGSQFVISAAGTKPGTDVLISRLEWTLVCPEPINLLDLLLSKTMIEPRSCSAEAGP